MPSARTIEARNGKYYKSNAESIRSSEPLVSNIVLIQSPKTAARKQYKTNPERKSRTARKQYRINPERKRRTACKQYRINPESKRRTTRKQYSTNSESKERAARKQYNNHPGRNKAAA